MTEISVEEAIARARAEMGLEPVVARGWRVRQLHQPDDAYYLVVFGQEQEAVAVATVSAKNGEVKTSARLSGRGPHLAVSAAQAITAAGADDDSPIELVWQPSRASRSPLYPLWAIETGKGTIYVDQQGLVWHELSAAGPGG
jgi:hypothetical protein